MPTPNFADKTVWTGDNLDILRRDEQRVRGPHLPGPALQLQPRLCRSRGQQGGGRAFKDTWTLSDLDVAGLGLIADEQPAVATLLQHCPPDLWQGDAVLPHHDGRAPAGDARRAEADWQHLPPLRPTASHYLKLLMDAVFGASLQFLKRNDLETFQRPQ